MKPHFPTTKLTLGLSVLLAGLIAPNLLGDDRDLLRETTAEPYVFFLLDTSASMALSINDEWVEAGADDPRSRLYIAREVLYELLADASGNIHFGFATLNQDELRVTGKHWLYYPQDPDTISDSAARAKAKADLADLALDLGYPNFEPSNEVESFTTDSDGYVNTTVAIDGDLLTFGTSFDNPATTGSCAAPFDLTDPLARRTASRYAKLGINSVTPTTLFVKNGTMTYELTFSNSEHAAATLPFAKLGDETIDVDLTYKACGSMSSTTKTVTFRKWREFLMTDDGTGLRVSGNPKKGVPEESGGLWDYQDARGLFLCGSGKANSGEGWEGNYDTGSPLTSNPIYEASVSGGSSLFDTHCISADCDSLFDDTSYNDSINRRELDRGDMLPMHWNFSNKDAFLARINPNHLADPSNPQFGSAFYFDNTPDSSTGRHPLKNDFALRGSTPRYSPIVAAGGTPLAEALNDFRCWYTPSQDGDGGKCGNSPLKGIYEVGFQDLLEEHAESSFNCRRPILIVISDTGTNCPGGAITSSLAGLNSATHSGPASTGVNSWLFNMGTRANRPLDNAGNGLEIFVSSKEQLRRELKAVLGDLDESTRSFAAATVPSVQADVDPQIYLTQFTPFQQEAVWQGKVLAFRKPLPIKDNRPDTTDANFLWDAAQILSTYQAPSTTEVSYPYSRNELRLSETEGSGQRLNRRILFAIEDSKPDADGVGDRATDGDGVTDNDEDRKVPRSREYFGPADIPTLSGLSLNQVRKDLWKGLGVVARDFEFPTSPVIDDIAVLDSLLPNVARAHAVFAHTSVLKEVTNTLGAPATYVMGDVFHATPLLVGNPSNSRYLAKAGPGEAFEGYTDFFQVQARRRKVLLVASNDSQLHAFDAGRFGGGIETGAFGDGTGREIFAYTPRILLPTVESLAQINAEHQWGIDATPVAADVFIDAEHDGRGSGATGPIAGDRAWRTVVVGGLRRGGSGYYALDMTQPDEMELIRDSSNTFDLGWEPKGGSDSVPGCFKGGNPRDKGDCDLPYPSILWEFTDPDLGHTWSVPDVGAIRVKENGKEVLKYVAIFGGGADPNGLIDEDDVEFGNYVYMVDIETGKMLYKRRVRGAVPAAPSAIDTNQDGELDRIYIGTTEGLMYRINLDQPMDLEIGARQCPATPPRDSTDACCNDPDGAAYGCVNDAAWEPYEIFDTVSDEVLPDGSVGAVRKPIFFRPVVIFVARLNAYALIFGTGNRDLLWGPAPPGGNRLYVLTDDSDEVDPLQLPRDETHYQDVTTPPGFDTDPLVDLADGFRGYYIKLGRVVSSAEIDTGNPSLNGGKPTDCQQTDGQSDCSTYSIQDTDIANEKLIAAPTAVSGLSVFSTFVPASPFYSFGNGKDQERRCLRRGVSRVYTNFTTNGEPLCAGSSCQQPCDPSDPSCLPDTCDVTVDPDCRPVVPIDGLVSDPFIEEAAAPCPRSKGMADILKKQLFPPTCNFASYSWNLSTMRADTGIECLARIPVCIVEKHWKDQ